MLPENEADWKRLGRLLAQRRVEVGARYKNKNLFALERELNRRMVWSVETGARDTYTADTLRDVERAYALAPGSIERTLAGGELEPLGTGATPVPGNPFADLMAEEPEGDMAWAMFPNPADRPLRAVWRQSSLTYEKREEKIAELRAWAKAAQEPPGRESAGLSAPR